MYRFISIRAWLKFSQAIAPFNSTMSNHYANYANDAMSAFRTQPIQPWWKSLGLHAAADAINTGLTTIEEQAGMSTAVLSDIVQLPSLSHFNQYFIVNSFAVMGALDRGVEQIRLNWGADIELGATTFFEVGHPGLVDILPSGPSPLPAEQNGWTLMCADWSTGSTQWLTSNILGLRPLENGWKRVLIAPHIAHTMNGVSGSIGTPYGIISINFTRPIDKLHVSIIDITLPVGVDEAIVQLSAVLLERLGLSIQRASGFDDLSTVFIEHINNGSRIESKIISNHTEAPLVDESNVLFGRTFVLEFNLKSFGKYSLRVFQNQNKLLIKENPWTPSLGSPFPPPSWPGRFLGSDTTTSGNWQNLYGKNGYVLFGWKSLINDLKVLPPYVQDVILWTSENSGFLGSRVSWENSTSDERALQDPQGTGRALGAATSFGGGTFIIDVILTAAAAEVNKEFVLSIYCVDYGPTPWGSGSMGENRTGQILLLTGWPDFNPMTPRQVLKDYSKGVWMRYSVNGNVRVRLGVIRGDMSVLSAIMFD
jgi:alpha-L-rhamnosidase